MARKVPGGRAARVSFRTSVPTLASFRLQCQAREGPIASLSLLRSATGGGALEEVLGSLRGVSACDRLVGPVWRRQRSCF